MLGVRWPSMSTVASSVEVIYPNF
ncbi:uncharacterized protein METZ01_LOCUS502485, partial [marine metagenome]